MVLPVAERQDQVAARGKGANGGTGFSKTPSLRLPEPRELPPNGSMQLYHRPWRLQ